MTLQDNEKQTDYQSRISVVFRYIDENLDGDLSLAKVASYACFSPFHFHRIFKSITGETLLEYVTRRRIEKAAGVLVFRRNVSVAELSLQYGFDSNSSFTRTFRKFYGVSPTEFRSQNRKYSKIRQLESKNGQESTEHEKYLCAIGNFKQWTLMNAKIEMKELPERTVACVACTGPPNLGAAFDKLLAWAAPRGLMQDAAGRLAVIYHDSFKITAYDKVRLTAALILGKEEKISGEISLSTIPGGRFVTGSYTIGLDEFEQAWTGLSIWLNENGYKKADRDPFEIHHNNFNEHPQKKCIVDLYVPVEKN